MIRHLIISSRDPVWVRDLKIWCNTVVDELSRIRVRGDGTTTRVENGVVSAYTSPPLPEITAEHKEHMSLVLELDEEMVTELQLTEETKYQALSPKWAYRKLQ